MYERVYRLSIKKCEIGKKTYDREVRSGRLPTAIRCNLASWRGVMSGSRV